MRYLIKFSYDGTNFCGYQKQPGKRTVEESFESALYSINNHQNTSIYASGRTDSGVHALCQCAHFDLSIDITLYKLKCALNSLLPNDIHVFSTEIVDKDFNSRFMVKAKTYEYYINVGEYSPIFRNYIYQYNKQLDIKKMKEALQHLIGKHDFKNFVSPECIKNDYVREIYSASIEEKEDIIKFTFTGNGFMKYQVRNMVGTIVKVGAKKLDSNDVKNILNGNTPITKIFTINSQGLYLKNVEY